MIEADGVERRFGRQGAVVALQGVTFRLDRADILGILGGDRSGKTSLVRILAGLVLPTAGRATVGGFDVRYADRIREIVGYLPQAPSLHRNMTIAGYLDFWAMVDGQPRSQRTERIAELLAFFDLTDQAREMILDTTTFTQRRTFLALALLSNPPVLLLDDPMAALTSPERDTVVQKLRALTEKGKTILVTATRLADLQPVCSHILTLFEGRATRSYETSVLLRRVGKARHARVFIESKAPASRIVPAVRDLHGVGDVKESEGAVILFVEPGTFRIEDLQAALETAGIDASGIREAGLTIGDIFRTLIQGEAS